MSLWVRIMAQHPLAFSQGPQDRERRTQGIDAGAEIHQVGRAAASFAGDAIQIASVDIVFHQSTQQANPAAKAETIHISDRASGISSGVRDRPARPMVGLAFAIPS